MSSNDVVSAVSGASSARAVDSPESNLFTRGLAEALSTRRLTVEEGLRGLSAFPVGLHLASQRVAGYLDIVSVNQRRALLIAHNQSVSTVFSD